MDSRGFSALRILQRARERGPLPRRLAFFLTTVLTIIVVPFAMMEALVRLTHFGSPYPFKIFNDVVVKGRPDARFTHRAEAARQIHYNNWGFHDRTRQVSTGGHRVLVLGDSFVEGRAVRVDRTFTAVLERELHTAGLPVDVINAGFEGTGTAYQYALWREYFKSRVELDHLLLCIYLGNDLEDNGLHLGSRQLVYVPYVEPDGSVAVIRDPSTRRKAFAWLRTQSALLNTMSRGYAVLQRWSFDSPAGREITPEEHDGAINSPEAWANTVNGTLRLIERWSSELESHGIRLSIAVINPATFYKTGRYRNRHYDDFKARLGDMSRRVDIPLLEIDFSRHSPEHIYSLDGVTLGHLNERGHLLAGNQIFNWMRETKQF